MNYPYCSAYSCPMCAGKRTRTSMSFGHTLLRRACLPVPAFPRILLVGVSETGFEPAIPNGNTLLKRARLPVPPLRLKF